MSKKNTLGPSVDGDFYATPKPYTLAILETLDVWQHDEVLDPCCGTGAMLEVFAELGFTRKYGIELQPHLGEQAREKGFGVEIADALAPGCVWPEVPLIISNPPFTYAAEFLEKSLKYADTVVFLLRLGFLAGAGRKALFDRVGMPDVYVVPRPSFNLTVKCKECGDRYTLPPDATRPRVCRKALPPTPGNEMCKGTKRDITISSTDAADYFWGVWNNDGSQEGVVRRLEVAK